jgi:TonB-linked SusC/RagA family outer membrane protein
MKKKFHIKRQNLLNIKKIWLQMRLITILLFSTAFCLQANITHSQNVKVNLDLENATLTDIFREIEKQSEYRFFYNNAVLNTTVQLNLRTGDKELSEVLKQLFDNTNLSYKLVDKYIVITNKNEAVQPNLLQQSDRIPITGIVLDESGNPIIGATVIEKETTNGITTDIDGRFSLDVGENAVLQISYIGYVTQEIPVGNQRSFTITLIENLQTLDEIIVVGYGIRQKSTLTGAVVSVKGEEILKTPAANISGAFAGRLPGVIINSRSGEPGGDNASIYVRGLGTTGDSSPLILIDGVERPGIGQLNPNDIESINVLKDSEAAIYGSRASNGVIVVTTKRGVQGKPVINLSYNQTFSQPTRNPKMADSYTFASITNEIRIREHADPNTNPILAYTPEELEKFRIGTEPGYESINYFDYLIRDWTPQHRTNLSLTGGSERVNFFLSIGELKQNGQYKESSIKYNQYNVRSNIDVNLAHGLTVSLDMAGQYDSRHAPQYSGYDAISHIFLYAPNWELYWPGTDYLKPLRGDQNIINMIGDDAGWHEIKNSKFEGSLSLKWEIPRVKGLSITARGSYDTRFQYWKTFQTPSYVYNKDGTTGEYIRRVDGMGPTKATLTDRSDMPSSVYLLTKVDYERSFGSHGVNAMFGYEQTQSKGYYLSAYKPEFESTSLPILDVGGTDKSKWSIAGRGSEFARQNYFGRINYDYKGKYMLQSTLRVDGSSNFPKENRFGYFPSFSAAWRLSEESFMKNLDWLNNLKFRGSWGMMGNDKIAAFQYLMTYSYGQNYVFNNSDVQGIYETRVPNPIVTWETSKTWDFGLEANLWKGKFGLEFDYFRSIRDDILGKRNATVPGYTGITLPDENIASVLNRGFELILTHQNKVGDILYSVSGNVAFARNKVKFIDEAPAAEPYQMKTGKPYGSELFYNAIGIFEDEDHLAGYPHLANAGPGDLIFEDVNKDGVINEKDQILITQTTIPEITFGLTASMQYKGFDVSMLMQGQENAKIPMVKGKGNIYSNFFSGMSDSWGGFLQWRADGRWIPGADNSNAKMPRAHSSFSNVNSGYNTHWIRDGGFLRFKNLEIGYTLPSSSANKIGLGNIRISVSGDNLFLIYDSMKELGYDPGTNDYWYYSIQRTINFGINVTF